LDGAAFAWLGRQVGLDTWANMRDAFVNQYRPLGFTENLRERLKNIKMGL